MLCKHGIAPPRCHAFDIVSSEAIMSFNKPGCARFGVHSIDHFVLQVPELAQAKHFLDAFGLRIDVANGGFEVRSARSEHRWAGIDQGPSKRLPYLSLNCYA